MYQYRYNIPQNNKNMHYSYNNNERFGGFITPLLLGGVAGYAIGNSNNFNNNPAIIYPGYPQGYYYQYPTYTTNYFYPYK